MKRSLARKSLDNVRRNLPWIPVQRFPDRVIQGALNNANPQNVHLPEGCVAICLQAYTVVNAQIRWSWGTDDSTNLGAGNTKDGGVQIHYVSGNSPVYLTENHQQISVRTNSASTHLFNVLCWIGDV